MGKVRRPVIIIFFPYLVGLIFTRLFSLPYNLILYNSLLLVILISAAVSLKYQKLRKIFLILIAFAIGCFFDFLANNFIQKNHVINVITPKEEVLLTGKVTSVPENYQDKTSFLIEAEALEKEGKRYSISGRVLVNIYKGGGNIDYGDRIKIIAKLNIPRGFKNPGGFDYQGFLKAKGILVIGAVKNDLYVVSRYRGFENQILEWIYDWRKKLIENINREFQTPNSSMLIATLFGDRSGLSEEIENKFKYSGTYHIFAISGFNIGLVGFIFYIFFRATGLTPAVSSFPSIFAVIFYSILAGMQPSVKRAMIMTIVYFLAVILKRESDLYNSLWIAAFIILVIDPSAVFDVGFILTFAATFFIIYLTPKFNNILVFIPSKYLRGLVSASLSAQIGVTPVLAFYFNNISLTAVLANLVVVPLASLIFGGGLIFIVYFSLFETTFLYINKILNLMLTAMLISVDFFSKLTLSYLKVFSPGIFQITGFYLLVFLIANSNKRRLLQLASLALVVVLGCSFFTRYFPFFKPHELKITFIDVGEGDSALIEFPDGKIALVDGGGTYDDKFDVGEQVVSPYLLYRGIRSLDYVILTHPHPDHMNGIKAILKNFHVKNFWEGCAEANYDLNYSIIKEKILKQNITYKRVSNGEKYNMGEDVSIKFFHPSQEFCDRKEGYWKNINNQSLVLQIIYKKVKILFTGDIEKDAMEDILRRNSDIKSTVIKVPHHGGRDSADFEFIRKVSSRIAIISVGANNPFRHPSQEALEIYKKIGAKIFRTDINGAVMLRTDGVRIWVETVM